MVAIGIGKAVSLLTLLSVARAGLLSYNKLVARSCNPDPPGGQNDTTNALQFNNNVTSIFAWQLTATTQYVGSSSDASSPEGFAANIHEHPDIYEDRLNAIGLTGEVLTLAIWGRRYCGINQDTENNIDHILKFARLVFTTQLDNIFADVSKAFTVLCDNWDYQRLHSVYPDPADGEWNTKGAAPALFDWVCSRSITGKPTKQVQHTPMSNADTEASITSFSQLFAWGLLGTMMNSEQVTAACTKDWDAFSANINKTGLNSSDFKNEFCTSDNQKSLPNPSTTVDTIKDKRKSIITQLLVVQLFSLSDERDYQEFLCHPNNYNFRSIKDLGLGDVSFFEGVLDRCRGLRIELSIW